MGKTYSELITIATFEERFEYLKCSGSVGDETFGSKRWLNQVFYTSDEWKKVRNDIIIRDEGCDIGIRDREIVGPIYVHHIIPITIDDVINRSPLLFSHDNLICVSRNTHEAIHYGDASLLIQDYKPRFKNDTCPWKH